MKRNKVVITGGAGFIGSNLADELIKYNQVCIIDDLSAGKLDNLDQIIDTENVSFVHGSILDRELLEKNFNDATFVFHLAAKTSVVGSIDDPVLTNDVNITGTLNVLLAARNNKVKKVVFASSSAVYGDACILPIKEDNPLRFHSPYALTKLTGEYYCRLFNDIYNLPTICLRYFNVFGPRQDPNSEYSAVVPSFISRVLNDEPLIIYGDGNQTRDFIYVADVVQANIIGAECCATGVINIGSGITTSINSLAMDIIEISARNGKSEHKEKRLGEINNSLADLTLAKSFGFKPSGSLRMGLIETLNRFKRLKEDQL